jgi:hypothetical protein
MTIWSRKMAAPGQQPTQVIRSTGNDLNASGKESGGKQRTTNRRLSFSV